MSNDTKATRPWARLVLIASLFAWAPLAAATPSQATPVLVVDADSHQVLYEEDAGAPWYPASTTKLMTALVVFEALKAG
ncbi:MAG: D-alanyl-D-alanine carboxypeptidase, partial [Shinella sp.]